MSFADERERHRGVSHHSLTILADVCTVDVNVPVPVLEDEAQRAAIEGRSARGSSRRPTSSSRWTDSLRWRSSAPATSMCARWDVVSTTTRAFFLAAGAAGVLAGRLAAENRRWRQRVD